MRALGWLFGVLVTGALLGSGAACNQIAGINEPIDRDGSAAGDGGASDAHVTPEASPDDPAAAYIGDWHGRGSGTITLTCNGQAQSAKPDPTTITISRQNGELVYSDPPCLFQAKLTASGLSLPAGQTCDAPDTINGEPATDHLTLGTPTLFKVLPDGKTATLTTVGDVDVIIDRTHETQTCSVQQREDFDRL